MGYTKNIAVIKGVKSGFSADGGELSGLVKAEKYSSELRVEVSLINFAPLTEGKYVAAISDGAHTQIIEGGVFEGKSDVDTSAGFAAAVFYVNGTVQLLASAVCGNYSAAVFGLKAELERAEKTENTENNRDSAEKEVKAAPVQGYEDEAIAAENYYEFDKAYEGGGAVCEGAQKEEDGAAARQNETDAEPCEECGQNFFEKMREEIEKVLSSYPQAKELCEAVEGSRWVEISYGEGAFYVFGVIYDGGKPKYLCYGIPAASPGSPPASMQGLAGFLEVKTQHGAGFWVMYQSADDGRQIVPKA